MLTLSFETFTKLPSLGESGSDVKDTLSMGVTCLPKVLLLTFNILLLLEVTDYFDLEEKETFTLVSAFPVQYLDRACERQPHRQLSPQVQFRVGSAGIFRNMDRANVKNLVSPIRVLGVN